MRTLHRLVPLCASALRRICGRTDLDHSLELATFAARHVGACAVAAAQRCLKPGVSNSVLQGCLGRGFILLGRHTSQHRIRARRWPLNSFPRVADVAPQRSVVANVQPCSKCAQGVSKKGQLLLVLELDKVPVNDGPFPGGSDSTVAPRRLITARLHSVAADLHVAPSTSVVLARVEKQPAARVHRASAYMPDQI